MEAPLNVAIGDVVAMKYGIENCRVIRIPFQDRIDVVIHGKDDCKGIVGVPLSWVEKVIEHAGENK